MMSVTLNKSPSTTSVHEDSPTKETPIKVKKERNALSQRFTKLSLFGRKHRGKETQSATLTREQLQEYLNSQDPHTAGQQGHGHDQDDAASISEEASLILWEDDGNVKAATPNMLVMRITDEKFQDSNLLQDVIVSYRSFTPPRQFLELLIARFEVSNPISLRVCAVLKAWVERQWSDFDAGLATQLVTFLTDTVRSNDILRNVADQLLALVKRKQSPETTRAPSLSDPPKPLLPVAVNELDDASSASLESFGPTVTVWSFPPKELARQLTLIEHRLYQAICPYELIAQAWAKPPCPERQAPNVLTLIHHFNKVGGWVCTEIMTTQDLQQRIERVLQIIDVAQHFFTMNNFNGLMAVLAGLHSSAVHRLKRTWAAVPEKSKETFDYLTTFMSSAKNYSQYREHLQKVQLPVLPYLGVCLSDLTFIEDGNPGEIGHLINFSKCRQLAAVIRKMGEFQSASYALVAIPFVQNYFTNFVVIDEKQAYENSTKLEPRTQSTIVSASAASAAFSSLTSSMGIEREFSDLGESTELTVDGEQTIDTMHARFRKDLARSRNNSLNIGEPFSVKVQLPGSLPVEMRMPANTTGKQAVKHFANFFSGINEQYCLVVMPCRLDAKGYEFSNEQLVKDVLKTREKNNNTTKLALFASPLIVTSAVLNGSSLGDCKDILVDLGVPLYSLFSLFQETLAINEEITLLAYDKQTKQVWWMNTHKSLEANYFSKSCLLVVFPVSNLLLRGVDSMAGGDKQGVLLSGGREGTLKVATVKQVLVVLSGPFLLCYKNKHDAAPTDVIALDRYSVQSSSAKHVSVLLDKNTLFPAAVTSSNKSHYSFAADMDLETRAWIRACQRNRGVLGDKVVFGEDLNRSAKTQIPVVLQKTVNFINSHALQMEGLFKPHTNSSLVQHYKNQFDAGVDVDFNRTNDACTVAQLLLMFFEELPDPLLSYELFSKFVEFVREPPQPDDEASVLREIVSHLSYPHMTVLAYLLAFLSQVSIENPIKTGIVNIFGPWLLRAPPLEGEPKGYKEIARSVLAKLIKHREKIFVGLSRRPEPSATPQEDQKPSGSNTPNNNNPQCREISEIIDKQLQNNAAIAKRVEMLKSQLESKYMENKYKSNHLKRQVSLHEDLQNSKSVPISRSSPVYHRAAKSASYATRGSYDASRTRPSHEVHVPVVQPANSSADPSLDPNVRAREATVGFDPNVVIVDTPSSSESFEADPDFADTDNDHPPDPDLVDPTDHSDPTTELDPTDPDHISPNSSPTDRITDIS